MRNNLPDFSASKRWNSLKEIMGITEDIYLPDLLIDKISMKEIQKLRTSGIDISNIKDFINPVDGTFDYKGQKVILYIKEQRYEQFNGASKYKYHLSYCDTLDWMDNSGRFERYVVTQRTDGLFLIDVVETFSGKYVSDNELCKMDVCKNCLNKLRRHYPSEILFKHFSYFVLEDFINKYNTKHIKKPKFTPHSQPKNEYPRDWREISTTIRKKTEYKCSKCGQDFSKNKQLLHVHHIDGFKYNVKPDNLKVLCYKCHSEERGHSKMKLNNYFYFK